MIKCPKCGSGNEDGTPLCRHCGAELPDSAPEQDAPEAALDEHAEPILGALRSGRKIEAVKIYRERHGVGLKEAKEAVERLAAEHGIAAGGGGCAGVVLLAVLGAAAAISLVG